MEQGINVSIQEVEKLLEKHQQKACGLNVLIAGKTGVGKSTLINTIYGSEIAKTGQGKPITQEIQVVEVNKTFSVFDTKGLELEDFEKLMEDLEAFLSDRQKRTPDEQIHVAWLCIAEPSRRVEEGEKMLYEILKKHVGCTIAIITKAEQDKDSNGEKFSNIVKKELQISDEAYFQRVRAESIEDDDGNRKPIKGVKELIDKTLALLDKAHKEAFIRVQIYDIDRKKEAAYDIISFYATGAGVAGVAPIPFADAAGVAAAQIAMLSHIARIYDYDISASECVALAGVIATATGVRMGIGYVAGSVCKFIPVYGSVVGGVINAGIAATATSIIGGAFVEFLHDNRHNIAEALRNVDANVFKKYRRQP